MPAFRPRVRHQQQRQSVSNLIVVSTQSMLDICIMLLVRHTISARLLIKTVRTKPVLRPNYIIIKKNSIIKKLNYIYYIKYIKFDY